MLSEGRQLVLVESNSVNKIWSDFLRFAEVRALALCNGAKLTDGTSHFALESNTEVQLFAEFSAPFSAHEMGEDFAGGLAVRLVAQYPALEKTILAARKHSGINLPWPPISISLSSIDGARPHLWGGNVFAFSKLRDTATQTDAFAQLCDESFREVYAIIRNPTSLGSWNSNPDGISLQIWLVLCAAYAARTYPQQVAIEHIRTQIIYLENVVRGEIHKHSAGISKIASSHISKLNERTARDLVALLEFCRSGKNNVDC